jgi:hypothetical protein
MNRSISLCLLALLFSSEAAVSQTAESVHSESRDAASAYIGTTNFVVGRLGKECLALLGRTESPQVFVQAWQQRNAKYFDASRKYMGKRLDQALASGGPERRDAVLREYTVAVRGGGEASVNDWFRRGAKEDVCKRAVGLIDGGAMDVSPKMPIFGELESLVSWAE